jgi:hypothetical protein
LTGPASDEQSTVPNLVLG